MEPALLTKANLGVFGSAWAAWPEAGQQQMQEKQTFDGQTLAPGAESPALQEL